MRLVRNFLEVLALIFMLWGNIAVANGSTASNQIPSSCNWPVGFGVLLILLALAALLFLVLGQRLWSSESKPKPMHDNQRFEQNLVFAQSSKSSAQTNNPREPDH